MRPAIVAFAVAAVWGARAEACTPAPGWGTAVLDAPRAAKAMSREAKTIDLVTIERLSPDFDFATRSRSKWSFGPQDDPSNIEANIQDERKFFLAWEGRMDLGRPVKAHARVVQRLKGDSGETFILNGIDSRSFPPSWRSGGPLARAPIKLKQLQNFRDQYDFADWPPGSICQNSIYVTAGEKYLVFRDAEGRLLQTPTPYALLGREAMGLGPAFVPVRTASDPWPAEVAKAILATP